MVPSLLPFSKLQTFRLPFLLLTAVVFNLTPSFGQIYNYTNNSTGLYSSKDANLAASNLTRAAGVSNANLGCNGATDGFGSTGWPATAVFDIAAFNTSGDYVELTLTPDAGFGLKVTGFSAALRRENVTGTDNDGPQAARYAYRIGAGGSWVSVNPGTPLSGNICSTSGTPRPWPSFTEINTTNTVYFRIYGLSSGALGTGDFYIHNLVINGSVCANVPSITLGPIPEHCYSSSVTAATLPYTASTGTEYTLSIPALGISVPYTALPSSPISFNIPAATAAGTYSGTITVRNSCGFESAPQNFNVIVNPLPVIAISLAENSGAASNDGTICNGASAKLNASGGISYLWSTGDNTDAIIVSPSTTTTYTVTVSNSFSCKNTATQVITVDQITATADAGPDQTTCVNGSVQIFGTFGGTATTGTWSDGGVGGTFVPLVLDPPNSSVVAMFYTPPMDHNTPITLTFSSDGNCPAHDELVVTYGTLDPLVLSTSLGGASSVTCGDLVTFYVEATSGFNDISSLQYSVNWDENDLEYVSDVLTVIGGNSPARNLSAGALTYVWFDNAGFEGEDLAAATQLWAITLRVVGSSGTAGLTISSSPTTVEVSNSQGCVLGVELNNDVEVELSPIEVTCPQNQSVCLNTAPFVLTDGVPADGTFSGNGVADDEFNPVAAGVGEQTITYSYTAASGCSNSCTFSINVNPLPEVSISAPESICLGGSISIVFNGEEGESYNLFASYTDDNGTNTIAYPGIVDGDALTLTEGEDFTGNLSVTGISVSYVSTQCETTLPDFQIEVLPAPVFGFTATVSGNTPQTASTANGNTTITLELCEGGYFCFSDYTSNVPNVGLIEHLVDGTDNNYYGTSHIDIPRAETPIPSGAAESFFNNCPSTYGPYNIDPGTSGQIVQLFTAYLDANDNGVYDAGDCLGDTITLIYNINAAPIGSADPSADTICSGGTTNISLSADIDATFSWEVSATTGSAESQDQSGTGSSISQSITGFGSVTYLVTPTGTTANECDGTPFAVTVVVNPPVAATVTVDDDLICKGQTITLTFNEENYDGTTAFVITANATDANGPIGFIALDAYDGASISYTEGVDFTGNLTITDLLVTNVENGCTTTLSDITIGVNQPFTVDIAGNSIIHVGSDIYLQGSNTITAPASAASFEWSSEDPSIASVNLNGINAEADSIRGVSPGTTLIYYTVTDNAGCVSTATHEVTVINALELISEVSGTQPVICGDEVTICVTVKNFTNIQGLFYTLSWDSTAYDFVGYDSDLLASFPDVEIRNALPGVDSIDYIWIAAGPTSLSDGATIFCYTLRAKTSSGSNAIEVSNEIASNDNDSPVIVVSNDVEVETAPITLLVSGSPIDVCPGQTTATLSLTGIAGHPNAYDLEFPNGSPFANVDDAALVVTNGEASVSIDLPVGLAPGVYEGSITVLNEVGCVSEAYPFSIIMDMLPPSVTIDPVTYTCLDDVPDVPEPLTAAIFTTASDNCTAVENLTVTLDNYGNNEGGGCAGNPYILTRVYLVTDEAGNSTSVEHIIMVIDDVAPTWVSAPQELNITLECSDAAGLDAALDQYPVAIDNCDTDVDIDTPFVQEVVSSECATDGFVRTITRTWRAYDFCGNSSDAYVQVITIVDTNGPIWVTGANDLNTTVECDDADGLATAQDAEPEALDACSNFKLLKTSGDFVPSQDCANAGTYTNTWIATDECGNTSLLFTQVITVEDTTEPVWETEVEALDAKVECGTNQLADALEEAPIASDNCDENLIISAPVVTYAPTTDCVTDGFVEKITRTWTVTDACGNISTPYVQVITVIDLQGPTWVSEAGDLDVTLECSDANGIGLAQSAAPIAIDLCSSTVSLTKTSGSFVPDQNCPNAGTYTNTWVATDDCNNQSVMYTQVITLQDTTAPTWVFDEGFLDRTVSCDDPAALDQAQNNLLPDAIDNCSGNNLIITKTPGSFVADSVCPQSGTYTNVWTATDQCGNVSVVYLQVITVEDNEGPTWVTAADELNGTFECSDELEIAAAQATAPVAQDNCGTNLTLTKTSGVFVPSQNCAHAGTYTNTWIATDECGNPSTTFVQVITIEDTTAPTWITEVEALDAEVECGTNGLDEALEDVPSIEDNCDGNLVLSDPVVVETLASDCETDEYVKIITRTWIVTDACGNTSLPYVQTITVIDTQAPTWVTLEGDLDETLECSDANGIALAQSLAPQAVDLCGNVVLTKISGSFVPDVDCANAGTYTNTWIATDNCGNESTVFTQVITIEDKTAPTWVTLAGSLDANLECSDAAGIAAAQNAAPEAIDLCDNDLTVVKVSGDFVAGTDCPQSGTYTNTWTVTDDCGNISATFTQVITIEDTQAPTWVTAAGTLNVTLECSDEDGLADAQALAPSASDLCGLSLDVVKTEGVFVPSQDCANAGTYTNQWYATDECGNESLVFTQVITIEDTTAPTWVTEDEALDAQVECGSEGLDAALEDAPIAADNCDANVVVSAPTVVETVSTDCQTDGYVKLITRTWTATDACNNTSTAFVQVIRVTDTQPPTWITLTGELNRTVECSDANGLALAQSLTPEATDNCGIESIVKTSGDFVAGTDCAQAGTIVNTWTATDGCGNTALFVQYITIEDTTEPSWLTAEGSLDATLECSDAVGIAAAQNAAPEAIDLCDNDLTVVKVSGDFVAGTDCPQSGTYTNTWTVTDDCGNVSATFTQVITIEDTQAPTWVSAPLSLNVTLECSDEDGLADAQALAPSASDLCGLSLDVVKTEGVFVPSQNCANAGTYTNQWYASDECGNESLVFTQVITIEDTTEPTWVTEDEALDAQVECGSEGLDAALEDAPVATDNCDANVVVSAPTVVETVSTDCQTDGYVKLITRTWYATDACNNTSTAFVQVIRVRDTQAPTWTNAAGSLDVTLQCNDQNGLAAAQDAEPEASDLCSDFELVKTSGTFVAGSTCSQAGTYTNTWVATDDCGNISTVFTQVITLEDSDAPVWTIAPGQLDVTLECNDAFGLSVAQSDEPTASDNCGSVTLHKVVGDFVAGANCASSGTYTNTWYATDECGHSSDLYVQVITIQDTKAPIWTSTAASLDRTISCSDESGYLAAQSLEPTASDLCSDFELVKTSGVFVAGQDCPQSGTYTNTWVATDDCGNESLVFTQVITVIDTQAPEATDPAPIGTCYQTVEAAEAAAIASLTAVAHDACTADEDLTFSATTVSGTDCGVIVYATVADECDNILTIQFETRVDNEGPVGTAGTISTCYLTEDEAETAAISATVFVDNCTGGLTITASTTGTCPATITVLAVDGCGNSTTVVYNNICIDNVPPVITTFASGVSTECSATTQAEFQAWINNHGGAVATGNVTWTTIPAQPSLTGGCSGGTTVTFVASDMCGNSSVTSATFNYSDHTAPTVSNPANITVSCANDVPAANTGIITASDNCDASLTIELVAQTFTGDACHGTYLRTYSVTDDCGNTSLATHMITVNDDVKPTFTVPANTTVNITANCTYDASVAVTGDVTDEHDNCSTGLNATYTETIGHGIGTQAKYLITRTWTLVDNCGNATSAVQTITVKDMIAPVIACPSSVSLPGTISENNCIATVSGINAASYSDNCNDGGVALSYTFTGATTGGNSGSAAGQTFYEGETVVTYKVSDEVGNTATCSFTVTINCTTIEGQIKWIDNPALGVKDATVRLATLPANMLTGSTLSDVAGKYKLNVPGAGNYSVTPVKNINRLNGVTSADATRIQQHLLGTLLPTSYKKIAADVNRSGTITTQDANVITQALAGNPTALAVFNVFWRFTPTSFVMPVTAANVVPVFPENITLNVTGPDIVGQDFYGMKIGDVTGDANPSLKPGGEATPLVWMLKDQMLKGGTEIELNFEANNFTDLAALQFALDFDPSHLQFIGFESLDAIPMTADNFGAFNAEIGELRVVWSQASGLTLSDGTPVLKARFKVLRGGVKLSDAIQLDDSAMECKAFTAEFAESDVKVVFVESVSATDPLNANAQLRLFQNQPNPFAGQTTIGFVIPEACDAQLRIMDVSGRELTHYNRTYSAGYHEIEFRMENAVSYGVLYYELITPYGKLTKKMMTAGK